MLTTALTTHATEFRANGFTRFDSFVSDDAVDELRDTYDAILRGDVDCGEHFRKLGELTVQVMAPSTHVPTLRQHPMFDAGRRAAAALLDCDEPEFAFDMMIFKPPMHPVETPWHQDLAYFEQPFAPAGRPAQNTTVQFWVAVDDVDETNGCMHFVPGAHDEPLLEHYVCSGDPAKGNRLLAIRDPEEKLDLSRAVACPLSRGGATAHSETTPHYTPPNRSPDRPRRAYIFNFHDPNGMVSAR